MEQRQNSSRRHRPFLADCARHLPQGVCLLWFAHPDRPEVGPRFCPLCRLCLGDAALASHCAQAIRAAAYEASRIGEPYFFRCWLGLNSFVAPLWSRGKLAGAVEFGGYLYQENAEEEEAFVRAGLPAAGPRERLCQELPRLQRLAAAAMRGHASFVEEALAAHGLHDPALLRQRHESYLQQRRIAELMHRRGGVELAAGAGVAASGAGRVAWGILADLAAAVAAGSREGAMLRLDEYLCHCLLAHASAPHRFHLALALLSAILEHQALLAPPPAARPPPLAAAALRLQTAWRELERGAEPADLCAWAARQVEAALARIPAAGRQLAEPPPPRIPLAQRADDWLAGHFQGKATLRAAAQALGASVPTLVAALRRHGGGTFHQRLISRRLDHAKQLLASTDQPLHAVARECGFADQSHLVRVFRDQINLTPGQFRALLDWDERQLAAAPPSAGAAAEE